MVIDRLRIYQYAYVTERGDTAVLHIVEDEKTGDTLRRVTRYPAYPLYDCGKEALDALLDVLIAVAHPRVIYVNSNVMGTFRMERTKDGYKTTTIRDRRFHDNELSTAFTAFSARDDGERSDDPERENETSGDERQSQAIITNKF